jgi:hypothetical protein
MKKNVGTIDSLFRITIGLFGLAWGISKMTRSPHRFWPKLVAFQSAMKAAEGIIRFCPLLALLGKNTLDQPEQEQGKRVSLHPSVSSEDTTNAAETSSQ